MAEISRNQIEMSAKFHDLILRQLGAAIVEASKTGTLAVVCLKDYGLTPILGGSLMDGTSQAVDYGEAPIMLYDRSQDGRPEYVFDLLLECLSVDEYGEPTSALSTDQVQRFRINEREATFSGSEGLASGALDLGGYDEFGDLVSKTYFSAEDTAGAVALLYADGRIGDMDDLMGSAIHLQSLGHGSAPGFLDRQRG